jgi:hypothetical protein
MRRSFLFVLALLIAAPLGAQQQPVPLLLRTGNVIVQAYSRPASAGEYDLKRYVITPEGLKTTAVISRGSETETRIFAPAAGHLYVTSENKLGVSAEGTGTSWIFLSNARLTDILQLPSGNLLVAEADNRKSFGARLHEVNARGALEDTWVLPSFPDSGDADRVLGASHMELLSDQCTLLYTGGRTAEETHRIRRYNLCTRSGEADFLAKLPVAGGAVGSIRQLPGGDILIATGRGVLRYTNSGAYVGSYPFAARRIALSTDGSSFWVAEAGEDGSVDARVLRVDPATGQIAAEFALGKEDVSGLTVVGEYRAAAAPPAVGDVIVVSGRCFGQCADEILRTRHEISLVSRGGLAVRRMYSDFVRPAASSFAILPERLMVAPAPDLVYFVHRDRELYVSRDFHTATLLHRPANGDFFSGLTLLASGNLLASMGNGDLVELDPSGQPVDVIAAAARNIGAIEVLADQCTILHSIYNSKRVARFNRCTRKAEPDFAVMDRIVTSIHPLPGGDVLVGTWDDLYRVSASGEIQQSYDIPGPPVISLTPEGDAFWALTRYGAELTRVSLSDPTQRTVVNVPLSTDMDTVLLSVVGEWRPRPLKRGRAVRR